MINKTTQFALALGLLGISQAEYRRALRRLTGHDMPPATVSRRVTGKTEAPADALAVLELMAELSPERRAELTRR